MSRPVHANAEATRRRILDQAVRLFSAQGVGETSIRDIARASGVSLAMVHHYYFSKERLLGACVGAVYTELSGLQREFEPVLARATSLEDLLNQAVITAFRFARERRELIRLLLRITISRGAVVGEGEPVLRAFLDGLSERFAALGGRPPEELRLPLQTMVYTVARYAVQDDAELAWVVGPTASAEQGGTLAAVEKHLVSLAQQVIGPLEDLESSGVRSTAMLAAMKR